MSTATALTDSQRAALREQAVRGRQTWHAIDNPMGWAVHSGKTVRAKRTMQALVTGGLLERRFRGGVYQYALTEDGRKEADR